LLMKPTVLGEVEIFWLVERLKATTRYELVVSSTGC
jgi:hypothetical protein